MSSRSLGELLLRPSTLSRITLPQTSSSASIRRFAPSWTIQTHRNFSASPSVHAAQPQSKPEDPETAQSQTSSQTTTSQTSQAIDDLFAGLPSAAARREARPPSNSAEELRSARQFGASWSPLSASNRHKRAPLAFDDMLPSAEELASPSLANKPSEVVVKQQDLDDYPRLTPTFGRTVALDNSKGKDFVKGINVLGAMLTRNKVRADVYKQRFHERPGLKRKRLKSERWRARFKKGFSHVTARVSELTRKGW